jgi:hypothetical protein
MNLPVDLNGLSRPTRTFLRLVADGHVSSTRLYHAALAIAGCYLEFEAKSSARAEASVRCKLRGRRFFIENIEEAAALQRILNTAVNRLSDYARWGWSLATEREIHRFARSLHLANILEMHEGLA